MSKYDRTIQIVEILNDHPEGMSKAEIAKRLNVHRSTIGRDVDVMGTRFPIIEDEAGRLSIDKKSFLSELHLSMYELEALHLAAKLFQRVMKFPFPHAAAAMRKLAGAQGRVSLSLAERMRETAEQIDTASPQLAADYTGYQRTIEILGLAISEYRPVRLVHFSRNRNEDVEYDLVPVTLEPHPEGKAVHLIAWMYKADPPVFRTLKTERIQSIELEAPAPELFKQIPMTQIIERLRNAWSIWTSDTTPVEVVLRFSPEVATRVKETQWHQSQVFEEDEAGSVIWRGKISEPKEMYPWIRGWGPDVEVLEPLWLCEMHQADFLRGVEMYGVGIQKSESTQISTG